ncbi:MAG: hypothetical protein JOY70_10005 [Acidisphaera sp.]|nr:hypothetical protein [Acidisphaera sp.]MBV9811840.1 hypothetical protein [Acetobacteraceae bacterium]
MLRLIGAIVIILLVVGPLLEQAGLLDHAGVFREFVDVEVRAFAELAAWIRGVFARIG